MDKPKFCYEQWSTEQMQEVVRCRVVDNLSCIPLRSDPVCWSCYELDKAKYPKELN